MMCDGFEIHSIPVIDRARCRHCRNDCKQVPNGLFGVAVFCPTCEIVYRVTMIKVPDDRVPPEYIEQCRERVAKGRR